METIDHQTSWQDFDRMESRKARLNMIVEGVKKPSSKLIVPKKGRSMNFRYKDVSK